MHQIVMKPRVSPGDEIKLRAANSILDRHIGKAPQSVSAYVTQRTIAADGTIVEGSISGGMMSPLLQAAHAHLAQEEVRKLTSPAPGGERAISPEFEAEPFFSVCTRGSVSHHHAAATTLCAGSGRTAYVHIVCFRGR